MTNIVSNRIEEIESGAITQKRQMKKQGERFIENAFAQIRSVHAPTGRKKWRVGDICPLIPKRGQKSVGYVRIKSIRLERLGDISERDAIEEGIGHSGFYHHSYINGEQSPQGYETAVEAYSALWESINGIGSWQKQQNDLVWVLGFEYIGKVKPMKAKTK